MFYPAQVRGSEPASELRVRTALAKLDDDWRVFHSVVWQAVRGGSQADGEADFVLLHPKGGLAILEVKGGRIEVRNGQWQSTDRNGVAHRIKDPFRQAKDSKYALIRYLEQLQPKLAHIPRVCHGVVFPDVVLNHAIGLFPSEVTWDQKALQAPGLALETLLTHWGQADGQRLSAHDLEEITNRLAPTLTVTLSLRDALKAAQSELTRLTRRQMDVLHMLRANRRCVVRGGAGTGKSLLAVEKARQVAAAGGRVLLVCYNGPLRDRLASECQTFTGVELATFHSLCRSRSMRAGIPMPPNPDDKWWDSEAAQGLVSWAETNPQERFDAILVDEAQDFAVHWISSLRAALRDASSLMYIFIDQHQQIYLRGNSIPTDWPVVDLDINCRNTLPIAKSVARVFVDPEPAEGIDGPDPVFIECNDLDEVSIVQEEVDKLIVDEGVSPSRITVLSDRHETIRRLTTMLAGGFPFVQPGKRGIAVETIHRFKGLEAEIVVVALSSSLFNERHTAQALLYVGLSRARAMLIVVGPPNIRSIMGSADR